MYFNMVFGFCGYYFFYPSLLFSQMFEHDFLGHMLFWVPYVHVFCIFVFAPVQRN